MVSGDAILICFHLCEKNPCKKKRVKKSKKSYKIDLFMNFNKIEVFPMISTE